MKKDIKKCEYCGRKAVIVVTNPLCRTHFTHYLEKKIKKTIKKYRLIEPRERIGVICKGDPSSLTALYIMNKFYPFVFSITDKEYNKIKTANNIKIKKYDKIVTGENTDTEAENIMRNIALGNTTRLAKLGPEYGNTVKPLYMCTQQEINTYAKIKKIKFVTEKNKKDEMKRFIDKFDRKYSGIKHSIVSSYIDMRPALRKRLLKSNDKG